MSARGHNSEAAGERAVRVRRVRADTREYLESLDHIAGREEIAEMLEHGVPATLRSLMVDTLLRWVRNMRADFSFNLLDRASIEPAARLVDLTEEQRWRLADLLRKEATA